MRIAGVAGLIVAALAVSAWRMPPGEPAPGLALSLRADATGELDVAPAGALGGATELGPRTSVEAAFAVTNQTGHELALRVRALPAVDDSDGLLEGSLWLGSRRVAHGDLATLRRWSPRAVELAPGERVPVRVRLGLPADARGYEARRSDVTVLFQVTR